MDNLKIEHLTERTKKVNELNNYINKVTPKIIEILKNNLVLKKDYEINKKCKDLIYSKVLNKKPSNIQCWLECSKFNIILRFKTCFHTELWSSNYIEEYIYLTHNNTEWSEKERDFIVVSTDFKEFEPIKNKTFKQVLSTYKNIAKQEEKIDLMKAKLNDIKRVFNSYLNK